jgi:acyl-CoA hydrolase
MAMKSKSPAESFTLMTQIVMPNDTNPLGNLAGGVLMHWMDLAAAIAAKRHANRVVVTAGVDFLSFDSPIAQNEVVTIEARVTRAFTSSMETEVIVRAENPTSGQPPRLCNTAFFTFVAVDQNGQSIPVNKVEPQSDDERKLYDDAAARRELRLLIRKNGYVMAPQPAVAG